MTVPFREAGEKDENLSAGFLRIIRAEGNGFDGALFTMNAKGEPLEFVFSHVNTPRTVLWRQADLHRRVAHELVGALFAASTLRPTVVFAKANEIGPSFFVSEIETPVTTCRIAHQMAAAVTDSSETGEDLKDDELHLLWQPGPPEDGSPERTLVERLQSAKLLVEPFERAEAGLIEAHAEGGVAAASV